MSADVRDASVPTTLIGKSVVYFRIAISDQHGHSRIQQGKIHVEIQSDRRESDGLKK
jgi:hypothetical protein